MGLDKIFADFLVAAFDKGCRFDKVITLGRLHNNLSKDKFLRNSSSKIVTDPYVDTFFNTVLKAHTIDALDYSDYQGANVVFDLNEPIKESLSEKYDAVIDGGTLEHVFDYPTALRNTLSLLKIGGSAFIFTPANNLFGHGFYQFSPDLFYRVLSAQNGFRVDKMAIVESYFIDVERGMKNRAYKVIDPDIQGTRATMLSCYPSLLLVQATKLGHTPIKLCALQSDYIKIWKNVSSNSHQLKTTKDAPFFKRIVRNMVSLMPQQIQDYIRSRYEAYRFYNVKRHTCFCQAPEEFFANNWLDRTDDPLRGSPDGQP